jgi:hypothetical protein
VNPLLQDREVTFAGDILDDIASLNAKEIQKFSLPTGTNGNIPMCQPGTPDYFKFLGQTTATLTPQNPTKTAETSCFKQTTYSLVWKDARTAKISFKNSGKKSLFCSDHYLATSLISFDIHTNWMYLTSSITYKFKTDEEATLAKNQGINIILICDSWLNIIPDLIKTVTLFIPDFLNTYNVKLPALIKNFMTKRTYDFLMKYTGATIKPRKQKVAISEEYIRQYVKSGDILAVRGPSGLGAAIFYATGGPVSHSAIAMWDDQQANKLWILEANEKGLVRMELEDWYAKYNCDIAWLHLSEENRAKFNPQKAWTWFRSIENLQYGIHNFIYTLIDDPLHNFDFITDINSAILAFNFLDMVLPGINHMVIGESLNVRLGTKDLKFADLLYEMDRRGTNIVEVMKKPELDGWIYDSDQNYVCSALAIKMLLEGGLMEGLTINSHEFTPRDVYMIQLFENDPAKMPDLCKQNDPGLPFCQLKGSYALDPKLYNSIKPYSHMNDNCPSMPPQWYRPPTC